MNDAMTTTEKLAEALRLGEEFANECINAHITAYGESWSWPSQNHKLATMREELRSIQEARAALAATPAAASEQQGDKWGAFGYLRKTNSKDNPPHGWAFHFAGRPGDIAVWTTQAPPQVLAATPLKERPDFIAGYDAGLIDGRACEQRDRAEATPAAPHPDTKDAERYRFLREHGDTGCTEKDGYGGQTLRMGDCLDAAIDRLRAGKGKESSK